MSELTKALDYIAEQLIKKEFAEHTNKMTNEEKISLVNSSTTISQLSHFIQRTTPWNVS